MQGLRTRLHLSRAGRCLGCPTGTPEQPKQPPPARRNSLPSQGPHRTHGYLVKIMVGGGALLMPKLDRDAAGVG